MIFPSRNKVSGWRECDYWIDLVVRAGIIDLKLTAVPATVAEKLLAVNNRLSVVAASARPDNCKGSTAVNGDGGRDLVTSGGVVHQNLTAHWVAVRVLALGIDTIAVVILTASALPGHHKITVIVIGNRWSGLIALGRAVDLKL